MTAKERIVTALMNKKPDAVPVTLGLSEMVPVRKSGLTYIEYFWHEKRSMSKDRCDTEKSYGADVFLHACEGPAPDDPEVSVEAVRESEDEVVYREIIHTSAGDLAGLKRITKTESIAIVEGFVANPNEDRDKVLAMLQNPESKDFSTYIVDWEYVGEDGHCGFWLPTPVDWWTVLRRSPQDMIYDIADYPDTIHELFDEYTRYSVAMIDSFLQKHRDKADSICLGGSCTSMSVISPTVLEEYVVDFVRAIRNVTARYDVPLQYHMCGRSQQAIPILVEAGVDGMDALECPPTGNVDLAATKRLYGDKISLRGNVNSIVTMLNGTAADVEREVRRCMDDAKSGGGFILGVGDQTPYWTSDENMFAFVEAGRKYGRY